jgi:hypothetical protein
MLKTKLPRFNATLSAKTSIAYACPTRRCENNYCNPPWTALQFLAAKLRESGATATVVALYMPIKTWYHDFQRLAANTMHFPPWRDMFFRGWLGKPAGVGPPALSIVVFRVTPLHGSTLDVAL